MSPAREHTVRLLAVATAVTGALGALAVFGPHLNTPADLSCVTESVTVRHEDEVPQVAYSRIADITPTATGFQVTYCPS